jgi:ubiquinone/menaquinone biosynthesis C-methylase UbiE
VNPEKWKYDYIYANQHIEGKRYGHSMHGKNMVVFLKDQGMRVLDVGCGHNEFIQAIEIRGSFGVDFSCPGADVLADLTTGLPFRDGQFEYVTSFDVLEHLRMETISRSLGEMKRVSRRFVFSIAYVQSGYTVKGETLHPTVCSEDWWLSKIGNHASRVSPYNGFLVGEW